MFLRDEKKTLPNTVEELDVLLIAYVKKDRREKMEYVSRLRASRGQSPLSLSLLVD